MGDIVKLVKVCFVSHRENVLMREGLLRQTRMQPHAYALCMRIQCMKNQPASSSPSLNQTVVWWGVGVD